MTRPNSASLHRFLTATLLLVTMCQIAPAADPPKRELLRSLQKVRPGFQITPIVHQIEARRGQSVPFEYIVEIMGEDTTLLVRPCALRQEENGVVLPDTESPAPTNIRLETSQILAGKAGQRITIKGRLRIPPTNTTFHSFGILVKNRGGKPVADGARTKPGERRLSVRFVTQYLLRCDIRVIGARGSALRDLELTSAALVERDGNAQAHVFVHNPTDSPLEFETRCRFQPAGGAAVKQTFPLLLPVRASLSEPERFVARILPGATVRVENVLPHPVFSGPHVLSVELHSNRRVQQQGEFQIDVTSGKFPAQDATVIRVARDLVVSPSQLELSLRRGGKRMVPVTIENISLQPLTVHLSKAGGAENALAWFRIRPDTLELAPGKRAKAMVSANSGSDVTRHQYAALRIDVVAETGTSAGSHRIPVALLSRSDQQHDLDASLIRWTDESRRSTLAVTMTNRGTRHAELNPRLRLTDGLGRATVLSGGYGKWLMPGETAEVNFPLIAVPPPGIYRAEVFHGDSNDEPTLLLADEVAVP